MKVSGQYLKNLRRMSQMFDMPISFSSFRMKDKASISLLKFNSKYDGIVKGVYDFSVLSDQFIKKENEIEYDEKGLTVNSLTLPHKMVENTYQYDCKDVSIDWEKYEHIDMLMEGKNLKGLIRSFDKFTAMKFITDDTSSRIEVMNDKELMMSYRLYGWHLSGDEMSSTIDILVLKSYKNIIPNDSTVQITFGNDMVVEFTWKDECDSEYMLLIAPRVYSD